MGNLVKSLLALNPLGTVLAIVALKVAESGSLITLIRPIPSAAPSLSRSTMVIDTIKA